MSETVGASTLQARRDALARELAELQWDLGGLAYEMAVRDHFRLDVLVRQAGRLQEVDARLSEVEHQLLLDRTGAAGTCPQCGTLYPRGALFCSQCALQLVDVQELPPASHALAAPAASAAPGVPATPGVPAASDGPATRAAPTAPAAPDAPYGLHIPAEHEATVAFVRPAEEARAR